MFQIGFIALAIITFVYYAAFVRLPTLTFCSSTHFVEGNLHFDVLPSPFLTIVSRSSGMENKKDYGSASDLLVDNVLRQHNLRLNLLCMCRNWGVGKIMLLSVDSFFLFVNTTVSCISRLEWKNMFLNLRIQMFLYLLLNGRDYLLHLCFEMCIVWCSLGFFIAFIFFNWNKNKTCQMEKSVVSKIAKILGNLRTESDKKKKKETILISFFDTVPYLFHISKAHI